MLRCNKKPLDFLKHVIFRFAIAHLENDNLRGITSTTKKRKSRAKPDDSLRTPNSGNARNGDDETRDIRRTPQLGGQSSSSNTHSSGMTPAAARAGLKPVTMITSDDDDEDYTAPAPAAPATTDVNEGGMEELAGDDSSEHYSDDDAEYEISDSDADERVNVTQRKMRVEEM